MSVKGAEFTGIQGMVGECSGAGEYSLLRCHRVYQLVTEVVRQTCPAISTLAVSDTQPFVYVSLYFRVTTGVETAFCLYGRLFGYR